MLYMVPTCTDYKTAFTYWTKEEIEFDESKKAQVELYESMGKAQDEAYERRKRRNGKYDWEMGFKLGDGVGIMDGGSNTVNISPECRWEESERQQAITVNIEQLYKILNEAKVNYVSQLINKPVEVEIDRNTFKGFRILTEVL